MDRLLKKYQQIIAPELMKELGLNAMEVPVITKVTVNMGLGREAAANSAAVDKAVEQLTALTGQKAVSTKAKVAISTFKIRENQPIGAMVTLRGLRMWAFLDKLISVVLPRTRDFQGVSDTAFDAQGNYALGIAEHTLFPEIDLSKVDRIRGLQVVMTIRSQGREHSFALLQKMGMPFKK